MEYMKTEYPSLYALIHAILKTLDWIAQVAPRLLIIGGSIAVWVGIGYAVYVALLYFGILG